MYLWGFGCMFRLSLPFGTTNSPDMALFSTVGADLVLVKTIVCRMCVPTTAVARGVVAGFDGVGLLCSVNLSTWGTGLGLSSLCNSEASWMAVSIARAISKALEYFCLASNSNRFVQIPAKITVYRKLPQLGHVRQNAFSFMLVSLVETKSFRNFQGLRA